MIKVLALKNFQGHSKTKLTLHPGINILCGPSDAGKSSVLRMLELVTTNRPAGDAYRKTGTDHTAGGVVTTEGSVLREKSKTKNQYRIGAETYKALQSSVPEEVTKLLNLGPENIQSQSELYFLLNETPGKVAKKLNEVVGLDEMDTAQQDINSRTKKINAERKFVDKELGTHTAYLESLEYVPEADEALKGIQVSLRETRGVEGNIETLEELLAHISVLDSDPDFPEEESKEVIQVIEQMLRRKKNLSTQGITLNNLLLDIQKVKIQEVPELNAVSLQEDIEMFNELEAKMDKIQDTINEIRSIDEDLVVMDEEVATLVERRSELMAKLEVCPLCGGDMDDDCK